MTTFADPQNWDLYTCQSDAYSSELGPQAAPQTDTLTTDTLRDRFEEGCTKGSHPNIATWEAGGTSNHLAKGRMSG